MKKLQIIIIILITLISCKKDWLDAKPDKALIAPSTVNDYQSILDNSNDVFNLNQPAIQEIGAGDFYVTYNTWEGRSDIEQNCYVYSSDVYENAAIVNDWNAPYKQIFYSNIVLEGLDKLSVNEDQAQVNNLRGSALFYRAFAFYNLAQCFAKPYLEISSSGDLGIPLRLTVNVNEQSKRSTVKETYERIIDDLKIARLLLPLKPQYKNRPSIHAVYAMLARVYLSMDNYDNALLYSDSAISVSPTLLHFKDLSITSTNNPLKSLNIEVIFPSTLINYGIFSTSRLIVDSNLYRSFDVNDIRRSAYFRTVSNNITFRGSYDGSTLKFGGLATDEMYLIRAECKARLRSKEDAMDDLNLLLINRWKVGTYIPITADDSEDALEKVLGERRKELCIRGLRWTDLRRLNKDERFKTTLTASLNGTSFVLLPNDPKYVFPIPNYVIELSNIEQNQR